MRVRRSVSLFAIVSLIVLGALPPALAEDSGTVTASVNVAEPPEACLLLSATTRDFGTVPLGGDSVVGSYTITSCAEAAQEVLVAGTGATGDGGASWQLGPAPGTDVFAATARVSIPIDDPTAVQLATTAQPFRALTWSGDNFWAAHDLAMPTPGSSGAGQTMSFDIVWIATLDVATEPNCDVDTCYSWWPDADGDGYGDMFAEPIVTTDPAPPDGYVDNKADCNDDDPTIHPGAVEVEGDGLDNNCDGIAT